MLFILMVQACTERMICPAYQSAFIHDEQALKRRFSYFNEDSTPKVLEASKNKYLLIEPVSYRRKLRSLKTIPMKDIYHEEEDSLAFNDEFLLAERDVRSRDLYDSADLIKTIDLGEAKTDSVESGVDSTYVISLKKEDFNIDQELYLWYLRKYLVYPDVRLEQAENIDPEALKAWKKKKKRKGIRGFFQKLFSKKDQEELASDTEETGEIEEGEEGDLETSATELEEEAEPKKKGPFSFLKKGDKPPKKKKEKKPKVKKEKKNKSDEPPPEVTEPKPEEDGDGEDDF